VFSGAEALLRDLGVPADRRLVGAVALGYPAADDRPGGSATTRPRRPLDEVVHRGRW
jgi:nitroreductase